MKKINFRKIVQKKNYFFICPGIAFEHNMLMTLDNEYYLQRTEHPPEPLFIVPIIGKKPDFIDLSFYADCLSYIHDVPFNISNFKDKSPTKPVLPFKKSFRSYFTDNIEMIYTSLVEMKLNGHVCFKWPESIYKAINIDLKKTYKKSEKEIQLYSMALKQSDPLTEFLCYYRIIESASGNNGKDWIKKHIGLIPNFNFGFIELKNTFDEDIYGNPKQKRRKNLFSCYKRRALNKINILQKQNSSISIEKYLYDKIRCGVAHGKQNLYTYDYATQLKDTSEAVYIIKLLARIAVENKIKNV